MLIQCGILERSVGERHYVCSIHAGHRPILMSDTGKLTFRSLFDPANYFAANEAELSPATADFFKPRELHIRRRHETRESLVKSDGSEYEGR